MSLAWRSGGGALVHRRRPIGGDEIDPRDPRSGRGEVGHSKRATTLKAHFIIGLSGLPDRGRQQNGVARSGHASATEILGS